MSDFGELDCNDIVSITDIPMRCISAIIDHNLIKIVIVQKLAREQTFGYVRPICHL